MSITAVASEAGVTPGLIHNTYPGIAEAIRAKMGQTAREKLDRSTAQLAKVKEDLRNVRRDVLVAHADIARLVSINETLSDEIANLRAQLTGKLAVLTKK